MTADGTPISGSTPDGALFAAPAYLDDEAWPGEHRWITFWSRHERAAVRASFAVVFCCGAMAGGALFWWWTA